MAVTLDDVRHIAGLARLGLSEERARQLMGELNGILEHMDVLSRVHTPSVGDDASDPGPGMPLRADAGPPDTLRRPPESIAPAMRDGFFIVPRLATHDTAEES